MIGQEENHIAWLREVDKTADRPLVFLEAVVSKEHNVRM